MTKVFALGICLLAFSGCTRNAEKVAPPEKGLTFCHFGPRITIHEIFHSVSYDPCPGTAKIQGVIWKCEKNGLVGPRLTEFLSDLTIKAEAVCKSHCRERSPKCEGSYRYQENCGLSLSPADAAREGKNFGCRNVCEGTDFAYCSLYSAGFMPYDPEMMKPFPVNCVCTNKRE